MRVIGRRRLITAVGIAMIGSSATSAAALPFLTTTPAPLNSTALADFQPGPNSFVGRDLKPALATNGAGTWVAVWVSGNNTTGKTTLPPHVQFSRSTDGGASWSPAAPVDENTSALSGPFISGSPPTIATDGAGTWLVAWDTDEDFAGTDDDADIVVTRSVDDGLTWSPPAVLNTTAVGDTGNDTVPFLAYDAGGDWLAAWVSDDDLGGTIGTDFDVLLARSSDGGVTWSAPTPLNTNAAGDAGDDGALFVGLLNEFFPESPHLATDGAGTWIAVWESNDTLGGTVGADVNVLFTRSTDGGVTWSAPAAVDTRAGMDFAVQWQPSVATDGAGNWVAAWAGNLGFGGPVDAAASNDDGLTWSTPITIGGGRTETPQVETDGSTWVIAWSVDANSSALDNVRVVGSTDAGASWSAEEVLPGSLTGTSFNVRPVLRTDGAGTWLAVWGSADTLASLGVSNIGNDLDVIYTRGAICGDGMIGGGETCEDGNTTPGDGCDARCRVEPCFTCSGLPSTCTVGLRSGCRTPTQPGASKLIVKLKVPVKGDSIVWKWTRGEETTGSDLGDPLATDDYGLCLFDDSGGPPTLLARATAPAGGTCLGRQCWKARGIPHGEKKLLYKDKEKTPDGTTKLVISPGPDGKAKVKIGAKGENLADPPLPFGSTTRVQLHAGNGGCWEATFASAVLRNDSVQFKAVSD
jgi:cysteine-rich repeat protein